VEAFGVLIKFKMALPWKHRNLLRSAVDKFMCYGKKERKKEENNNNDKKRNKNNKSLSVV
jgi:hypothetical protein